MCILRRADVLHPQRHVQTGSSGWERLAQQQRLRAAVAAIRRRRPHTEAAVLVDECLALLDEAVGPRPACDCTPGGRETLARTARVDGVVAMVDGDSPAVARLKQDIRSVASDPYVSALIRGESGTGKERVARAIHEWSARARGPFVVVNCAGLAPALAEDELFGHVRGAFTGAITDRPSPFERANGGTVFLDEIGDLTPDAQMKLLRALQERTVHRLGGAREIGFDARVVAATNVDLEEAQRRGRFRQDLYYRLKVFELFVPPLRYRGEADLRQLIDSILSSLSARRGRVPPTLAAEVWEAFTRYAWPGNVRELHNTLERMIVAAGDATTLTAVHLPQALRDAARSARFRIADIARVSGFGAAALPTPAEAHAVLQQNRGNRGKTADVLGISRHQLYRLLKRPGPVDSNAVA
jgi:two-component system, NtrC family, response regulator HydG